MGLRRNPRYVEVLLLICATLSMGAKSGAPADGKAVIQRGADRIPTLDFEETELDVKLDDNGPIERPFVMLNGRFKARDGSLTVSSSGNRPIKLDKGERFRFRVYLKQKHTDFKLAEVDALGQVKYESIRITFDGWENFRQDLELDFKREFIFIPSVGLTSTHYTETETASTGVSEFSGILITPKLTINYRYAARWTLGVNTFFASVPLSTNIPGFVLRFLGVNARIAYQLSSVRDPWNLSLSTGIYYATTLAPAETMGFANAMGPQFTANLRYRYNPRNSLTFALKLAPVGEAFYLRKLSDIEIAFGLGLSRSFNEGKNFGSITLDWARFRLLLNSPTRGDVQITNQSISLSAAYTL